MTAIEHHLLGFLGIEWKWDWSAFWPELAAGLVTFFLGVIVTLAALRLEAFLRSRDDFRRFQALAEQVLNDLRAVDRVLAAWARRAEGSQALEADDIVVLTWAIPGVQATFAEHGVQVSIQVAFRYFAEARRLSRVWNAELRGGGLSDDTRRQTQLTIVGTQENVKAAVGEISKAAKLSQRQGV